MTQIAASPPPEPAAASRGTNLALYRKYRSATFAEIIGQEHVTKPLSTALEAHRINHAYLFSGPRGCGKTSSARIMARSLNCAQGPTPTPCGVCDSCRELAPNGPGSIDVIEMDAASHNGVDDARDLRERAYYAPARDRYKVYIIDEAHMVTNAAFNALLKLVEEPPDFVIIIFATTEPEKVLQTIRSRTHHYPFRLVPPGTLRTHLEQICAAEGATVEPAVFPLVVRAGGGSVRDSLSLMDQLLAGAGPEGVTYRSAVALLGVTDGALLDDMIGALGVGDAASVYGTIDRVVEAGHEPRRFAADLLDRLRDLLILDAVPEAAASGLLDLPEDAVERMTAQANQIGRASAARYAEIVHTALTEMRGTTAPRLVLELVCARMLLPDASTDSAALLQRLERLERREQLTAESSGSGGRAAAAEVPAAVRPVAQRPAAVAPAAAVPPTVERPAERAPASAPPPAPVAQASAARPSASPVAPQRSESARPTERAAAPSRSDSAPVQTPPVAPSRPAAPAGTIGVTDIRNIWPQVLEEVKKSSRRTRALLETVKVDSLDGTTVRLLIGTPALARLLRDPANLQAIAGALSAVIAGSWSVEVDVTGDPSAPRPSAPPPRPTPKPTEAAPAPSAPAEETGGWPTVTDIPGGLSGQEKPAAPVARPAAAEPGPEEPDDYPPDDYADEYDAAPSTGSAPRRDPEAEALTLLETSLGARKIDN